MSQDGPESHRWVTLDHDGSRADFHWVVILDLMQPIPARNRGGDHPNALHYEIYAL
jgi:hypothetical protein